MQHGEQILRSQCLTKQPWLDENFDPAAETFTLQLPSAAALRLLDLRLRSGKKPEYVDAQATLRWQDPSLHTLGAGAALVSRDYFLQRIRDAGLEPVWIIAGEKHVYGGQFLGSSDTGYGGTLWHTTVFTLDGGNIQKVGLKTNFRRPSPEKLEALRASKWHGKTKRHHPCVARTIAGGQDRAWLAMTPICLSCDAMTLD